MVRRASKSYREDEILLSHEGPLLLSDDISLLPSSQEQHPPPPSSATSTHSRGNKSSKKGGWRSRLFGGGSSSSSISGGGGGGVSTPAPARSHRAPHSQRQHPPPPLAKESTAIYSHPPPPPPRRHQSALVASMMPDLAHASSSSSSQNNNETPHDPTTTTTTGSRAPAAVRRKQQKQQQQQQQAAGTRISVRSASQLLPEQRAAQSTATTAPNSALPATGSSSSSSSSMMVATQSRSMPVPNPKAVQALKRPFGRESVRPEELSWIVMVSPAEWDADESLWKHRISIQRRIQSGQEEILEDLTHGMTLRSIPDFWWLEQSLQAEFHGALLLPSLSIALGVPDLQHCQLEVDASLLTHWLSDVFNGIRGQGEWCINPAAPVSWRTCEAMEAFMYRADLLTVDNLPNSPATNPMHPSAGGHRQGGILRWMALGDLCGLTVCVNESDAQSSQVVSPRSTTRTIHLPLNKQTVSSKALGDARTLNVQDSFVDVSPDYGNISRRTPAQHTELLQAERS